MSTDFNPDHLPEHERSLVDNPHEAIYRASWQLPYLAAGRHMVQMTGDPDTFFGGKTPEHEQIYQNVLNASKAFYDHAFRQLSNKAPTADEAPVAKEGFRHGGKVQSIADGFQKKLDGKQRIIASLEKAHAHKPNSKINERLIQERGEAERIQKHIGKIKLYAS